MKKIILLAAVIILVLSSCVKPKPLLSKSEWRGYDIEFKPLVKTKVVLEFNDIEWTTTGYETDFKNIYKIDSVVDGLYYYDTIIETRGSSTIINIHYNSYNTITLLNDTDLSYINYRTDTNGLVITEIEYNYIKWQQFN
jgi:hypothetical protein